MKKEIKKYTTVCDICEQELFDSGVRSNNGSFEEPYFNRFDIDLCYTCAGKLFATQIGNKLSGEKLQEMIIKTKMSIFKDLGKEVKVNFDMNEAFKAHPESELKLGVPKEVDAPPLILDSSISETNLKTLGDL